MSFSQTEVANYNRQPTRAVCKQPAASGTAATILLLSATTLALSHDRARPASVSDVSAVSSSSELAFSAASFMYGLDRSRQSFPVRHACVPCLVLSIFLTVLAGLVADRHYMGAASSSKEMTNPPAVVQPLKEHTATVSDPCYQ